ncbi:hypothetical protein ACQKDA_00750 [Psychrobacter sp. NPDC078370]|uniref:hypothetical protein n=1 Tax=unclassified Psychrobacter TaxID=196806 RepID=UPI000C7E978C|nr:hypothetical protein [Psychrobacter sp. MES7-P7E]PLT21067.1 hypothetical protein CXF62_12540 [Psychrobacter sp. MES7-P7E]|tara:strand:+ start:256 stop:684 length:429 start_codon:yes stop_codon:yes gene_type:complete
MSIALGFCTVSNAQLESIISGEIDLHEMRANNDNQYENVIQASFEFYTLEVMDVLGSGEYPISNVLFLANQDTELYEEYEGVLYDNDVVAQIFSDFKETDLDDVIADMGYADDEALLELFKDVQKLFEFADEKDMQVIGFTV